MQLFAGMLASCSNPAAYTAEECAALGERWANPVVGSFDNFGEAMRLLYVMSTGDQWEVPMRLMMGATAAGVAPGRDDFSPAALFSLAWMFAGYVFAINLFVGVRSTHAHVVPPSAPAFQRAADRQRLAVLCGARARRLAWSSTTLRACTRRWTAPRS